MTPKFRLRDSKRKEWYGASDLSSLTWYWYGFQRFGECYYQGHIPIEDLKDLELSQSTGLADKNGKEIYEGDIVRIGKYKTLVKIEFITGAFWTMSSGEYDNEICGPLHYFINNEVGVEVIGNKYEKPELLDKIASKNEDKVG